MPDKGPLRCFFLHTVHISGSGMRTKAKAEEVMTPWKRKTSFSQVARAAQQVVQGAPANTRSLERIWSTDLKSPDLWTAADTRV